MIHRFNGVYRNGYVIDQQYILVFFFLSMFMVSIFRDAVYIVRETVAFKVDSSMKFQGSFAGKYKIRTAFITARGVPLGQKR